MSWAVMGGPEVATHLLEVLVKTGWWLTAGTASSIRG